MSKNQFGVEVGDQDKGIFEELADKVTFSGGGNGSRNYVLVGVFVAIVLALVFLI